MYINTRKHTLKFEFLQTRFQTRKKRKPPFFRAQPDWGLWFSVTHTHSHTLTLSVCRVRTFFFIFFSRIRYSIFMCMYVQLCTCSHTHTHAYTRVNLISYKPGSYIHLKKKKPNFFRDQPDEGLGLVYDVRVTHTHTHTHTHTLCACVGVGLYCLGFRV